MWHNKPRIHLLFLDHFIAEQLKIEERLLRLSDQNYCLLNIGSAPAVVMGIAKKPVEELHPSFFLSPIPLIQRLSGGGTVFVDQNTFFFTLIFNKSELRCSPFPEKIMEAIGLIFHQFCPKIRLQEQDFVIGNKKVAGNAQYLTKQRVLHHSSLLYDFERKNMDYLLLPKRRPAYRAQRSHAEFLTSLKGQIQRNELFERLQQALEFFFEVRLITLEQLACYQKPLDLRTQLLRKELLHPFASAQGAPCV